MVVINNYNYYNTGAPPNYPGQPSAPGNTSQELGAKTKEKMKDFPVRFRNTRGPGQNCKLWTQVLEWTLEKALFYERGSILGMGF